MISVKGFPCEEATQLLAELREAVQCFLLRMAAIFSNRMQQLIFLINNYDLILGVLMVSIDFDIKRYNFNMSKERIRVITFNYRREHAIILKKQKAFENN